MILVLQRGCPRILDFSEKSKIGVLAFFQLKSASFGTQTTMKFQALSVIKIGVGAIKLTHPLSASRDFSPVIGARWSYTVRSHLSPQLSEEQPSASVGIVTNSFQPWWISQISSTALNKQNTCHNVFSIHWCAELFWCTLCWSPGKRGNDFWKNRSCFRISESKHVVTWWTTKELLMVSSPHRSKWGRWA